MWDVHTCFPIGPRTKVRLMGGVTTGVGWGGVLVLLPILVFWTVEIWPKILLAPVCPREEKLFAQSILPGKLQALKLNQPFRAGTSACKRPGILHEGAFICSRLRAVVMATWILATARRSYTHKGNASKLIKKKRKRGGKKKKHGFLYRPVTQPWLYIFRISMQWRSP